MVFGKDPEEGKRLEDEMLGASTDEWAAAFGTENLDEDDVNNVVHSRGNTLFWSLNANFASANAIRNCLSE